MVRNVDQDPRRRRMLRHVIELCADLDAKVVAECVETLDELKAVIDCGAHYIQGYLLARPAYPPPTHVWPLAQESQPEPDPAPQRPIARLGAQGTLLSRAPAKPGKREPSKTTRASRKPNVK
jgi:EAL domain-containing protein (putative c-di-GMP-specific phosphodiesterase class I)